MTADRRSQLLLAVGLGMLPACSRPATPEQEAPPSTSERMLVTAGELEAGPVAHRAEVRNPLEEEPAGVERGRRLFIWFNCAGCHGINGGGGIGPPLRDAQWIYGSTPASIFESIATGRPNGMPAFGGKVPDEEIWRIELYVRSLGGADTLVRAGGTSGRSPSQSGG
jgi:cytochrome c oxidase cbb3-type subunit 3